jgi:hypothetical protein
VSSPRTLFAGVTKGSFEFFAAQPPPEACNTPVAQNLNRTGAVQKKFFGRAANWNHLRGVLNETEALP